MRTGTYKTKDIDNTIVGCSSEPDIKAYRMIRAVEIGGTRQHCYVEVPIRPSESRPELARRLRASRKEMREIIAKAQMRGSIEYVFESAR